jgi:fatty acid synthase
LQLAELTQLVADGIRSGEVRPLPVTIFARTQIEEAFRFMASGNSSI